MPEPLRLAPAVDSGAMDRILALIEHYGYLAVFFGVMLESTGVPLPGETILLASGVLAQQGHLGVEDAIVFGILGAVVGDQLGYWAGREGGRPFVLKWGRYVRISPSGSPVRMRSSPVTGAKPSSWLASSRG
jgi:membrane protein DedA with SNARE-associated domain